MTNEFHIHNKSDKPDNIIIKEQKIIEECEEVQDVLPKFLKGFFIYLKGNVLPMSRLAYLRDIKFFMDYLVNESGLVTAKSGADIAIAEFKQLKARDINHYLDYCRRYKVEKENGIYIYENDNKTLARKRSSVSVMFKFLYRDELMEKNITDGFDPIKLPKAGDKEIKALQDNEVMIMLDAVSTGEGLTKKEKQFWHKTKLRDKAILVLFITYGLRLSELQQLNVSSINFGRGEFKIYRKRGKEAILPLNNSVIQVLEDYLNNEHKDHQKVAEDSDALFLSLQGKRMTERQIRQLVKKYTSIALGTGRDSGYSPHKLRATTATSLIERGHSIYDVQALLSHDNITTTQLYAAHKKNATRELVKDMEWETEFEDLNKD